MTPATSEPARLLIVDDHELARAGLRAMLAGEPGLQVVGEAADGRAALQLCCGLRPDVVLMDIRMPDTDGLVATRALKQCCPAARVIVVTVHEDPQYLLEALKAGADGYVLKDATRHELIKTIRHVLSGEALLDAAIASRLLRRLTSDQRPYPSELGDQLTAREVEVLRLMAQGRTNREIGLALSISPATAKNHVANILGKLRVADRTAAAVRAIELGLLPKPEKSPPGSGG